MATGASVFYVRISYAGRGGRKAPNYSHNTMRSLNVRFANNCELIDQPVGSFPATTSTSQNGWLARPGYNGTFERQQFVLVESNHPAV